MMNEDVTKSFAHLIIEKKYRYDQLKLFQNFYLFHFQVRTSSQEIKESDKKGLLWILDEEAIFPGATEDSFMDRLFTHHGEQKVKSKIANPQIQRIEEFTNVDFQ